MNVRKIVHAALVAGLIPAVVACTVGDAVESGAAGLSCYSNGTCNSGLTCVQSICVPLSAIGSGTVGDGTGGPCDSGRVKACYGGPAGSENVGICRAGRRVCEDGGWAPCRGEIKPSVEEPDGLDNNCDGTADEGFPCSPGQTQSCGETTGSCEAGIQTCDLTGRWGSCEDAVGPAAEACDGADNDCDGDVDEMLERACYGGPAGTEGHGRCHGGTERCEAGDWGSCEGQVTPRDETCNGKDDDCDDETDETCDCDPGATQECGSAVGLCEIGTQTCGDDGQWGDCDDGVEPVPEVCDADDNDCDGEPDDSLTQPCYTGPLGTLGPDRLCATGTQACSAGLWGICIGQVLPTPEVCDGLDNDCNGEVDEALSVPCYEGPAGTLGFGVCTNGGRTCNAGDWGACVGQVTPSAEVGADGLDNDCDDAVDEGACSSGMLHLDACGCVPSTPINCHINVGATVGVVHSSVHNGQPHTFEECQEEAESWFSDDFTCGATIPAGPIVYQEIVWGDCKYFTHSCP